MFEYGYTTDSGEFVKLTSGNGNIAVVVADSSAGLKLTLDKDSDDYKATGVTADDCQLNVNIVTLEFGGSLEAWIIDLFAKPIEVVVETQLGNILCADDGLIEKGLSDSINPLIQDFNDNIAPGFLLNYPDPEPYVGSRENFVKWTEQGWMDVFNGAVDLMGVCLPLNDIVGVIIGESGDLKLTNLNVTTNITIPTYADMTLGLDGVNATGLNTFSKFDVLEVLPSMVYSLSEELDLDSFGIQVGAHVDLEPLEQLEGSIPLHTEFVIELGITELKTDVVNFLAVEAELTKDLYVEQVIKSPLCLANAISSANFTDLGVSVSISNFQVEPKNVEEGVLEDQIDNFVNVFASVMLEDFSEWVTDFISGTVQGPVKELANTVITNIVGGADGACEVHEEWTSGKWEFLEFDNALEIIMNPRVTDTAPGERVQPFDPAEYIDDELVQRIKEGFLSPAGINNFADCIVGGILGAIGAEVDISPMDGFRLQVKDIYVEGLNTFYALNVSTPSPYNVRAGIGLGDKDVGNFGFGMKVVIEFGESIDELDVKFRFSDLSIVLEALVKVEVATLMNMRLKQMSNPSCLMSTLDTMALEEMSISMGDAEIDIGVTTLSSSTRWLYGGTKVSALLNKIFAAIFWGATPVVNELVRVLLEGQDEVCLSDSNPVPKDTVVEESSSHGWIALITGQNLFAFFFLLGLLYLYRYRSNTKARKRRLKLAEKAIEAGNFDDAEKILTGMKGQTDWNTALVFHPDISPLMRYGVVVVQICLLALFVVANLQPGASVDLYLKIAQDPIVIHDLFLFTLAGTISDMLNAGVYFLAIVIILFSGCYPYCKVMTQLVCWCLPTSKLSPKRRESILLFVGAIGKWSLVDTFVLFLMMVAFNMRIALQEDDVRADVFIVTKFGFYGFLFATMASLSMGSLVLWFHRYTTDYIEVDEGGPKISLSDITHRYGKLLVRSTKRGRWVVTMILTLTALVCILGSIIPSFRFDIEGLAGMALELTPNVNPTVEYSLISLGLTLPYATLDPNDIMIRWCQATYFIFSLICPLCYLAGLWMLWCKPMTLASQRTWFVMTEVFSEWAAMEVFVISIIACSAQIGQLAYFMVGGACDEIDLILQEAMKVDKEIKNFVGEPTCFGVAAYLEPGAYLLLLGCIVFTVVGRYLQDFCHRGLEDRLKNSPNAQEHKEITRRLTEVNGRMTVNRFSVMVEEGMGGANGGNEDEVVGAKEKMGCLKRNLFHFCDRFGLLEVVDEESEERVTLGFAMEDVEEEIDGLNPRVGRTQAVAAPPPPPPAKQVAGAVNGDNDVTNPMRRGGGSQEMEEMRTEGLSRRASSVVSRLEVRLSEDSKKVSWGRKKSSEPKLVKLTECKLNQMDLKGVGVALDDLGLGQYKEAFMNEGIDGPVLVAMTFDMDGMDECLRDEIGVEKKVERAKIKGWVSKMLRQGA